MRTTPDTRLLGVLQHPVGESLIHTILSQSAETAGIDAAFHLLDAPVKEIPSVVEALRTLLAGGVYITGRLRTAAASVVDYLSDEAHGTGVINTIVFDGDSATGHNTEAKALIDLLLFWVAGPWPVLLRLPRFAITG